MVNFIKEVMEIVSYDINDIIENPWESPNKGSESYQVLYGHYPKYLLITCYNYNIFSKFMVTIACNYLNAIQKQK